MENVSVKPMVVDGCRCRAVRGPFALGPSAASAASRRLMLRSWNAAMTGKMTTEMTMQRLPTVGFGMSPPWRIVSSSMTAAIAPFAIEVMTLFSSRLYGLTFS